MLFFLYFTSFFLLQVSESDIKSRSAKKLAVLILLFGATSISNTLNAQQPRVINLHDAIQTALDSNLSVKSAALSIDVRKALKGTSVDLPKTVIDGQYGQFNSFTNDNSFAVSQSFAFPTVYVNRSKLANANVKSSELQVYGFST